ncbi:MAG: RluA family pseudouridine synthase [Deltaproteobacteria bacterium]|nr:RluA family pseudouridine synthase [Deltaproteobacteria bacterium]
MDHNSARNLSFSVTDDSSNQRIDTFLASRVEELTRSRVQGLIRDGFVKVNERSPKISYRLKTDDLITLNVPPAVPSLLEPEPVKFTLIHEDSSLIVLNKPAGLVIHPAPGHSNGTLVHGLLQHCRDLSGIGGVMRPGIVHRLDKDTSGIMVVAKNDRAHEALSRQFKERKVTKRYLALVHGSLDNEEGEIDLPIGRHPKRRKEMTVLPSGGRNALTIWHKKEEISGRFSLLDVTLKTGRTHQIRVHMSHIGHPVVGDPVYGHRKRWWMRQSPSVVELLPLIKRQMLHAERLGFIHPDSERYSEFMAPMPGDMAHIIDRLRMIPL